MTYSRIFFRFTFRFTYNTEKQARDDDEQGPDGWAASGGGAPTGCSPHSGARAGALPRQAEDRPRSRLHRRLPRGDPRPIPLLKPREGATVGYRVRTVASGPFRGAQRLALRGHLERVEMAGVTRPRLSLSRDHRLP